MISEFFAVTMTSVYHVKQQGKHGGPSAVKIAQKSESAIQTGETLEKGRGRLIAICRGLLAFIPKGREREPANVNTLWYEGGSSPIVALFKAQDESLECFGRDDLQQVDSRWLNSTKQVLENIGEEHPGFVISHWHGDCLLPELDSTL